MWCGNNGTIHEGTLFASDCLSLFQFRHIKQVIFFTMIIIAYILHCILQVVVMLCYVMLYYVMLCYAMQCYVVYYCFDFTFDIIDCFSLKQNIKLLLCSKVTTLTRNFVIREKNFAEPKTE